MKDNFFLKSIFATVVVINQEQSWGFGAYPISAFINALKDIKVFGDRKT